MKVSTYNYKHSYSNTRPYYPSLLFCPTSLHLYLGHLLRFYSPGYSTAAPSFGYLASRRAEVPPVVVAIIYRWSWGVLDGQYGKDGPDL
jgi:hypothetical protein